MVNRDATHTRRTDSELAALTRQGHLAAYCELMRRHFDGVYRVASAILHDPDLARDAAQESFVEAYLSLGRYDGGRPFRPWIMGICAKCAAGALRRERRFRRADRAQVPANPELDPGDAAMAGDLRAALREAIAQLPRKQRIAIRLSAMEGTSLAEVAEIMGCAEGTVRSHVHRARTRLRELLADRLQEDHNGEL